MMLELASALNAGMKFPCSVTLIYGRDKIKAAANLLYLFAANLGANVWLFAKFFKY
jgi:hypothetical protein